jgi:hypothetical protein
VVQEVGIDLVAGLAASRLPGPAATGPGIVGLMVEVDAGGDQHDQDGRGDPVDD